MKYNKDKIGTKTENLAGGEAFAESEKLALLSLLLTSFVKDQFYRSESKGLDELKDLVKKIADKKFLAKSAIFARNEFGMRSITHALTAELFRKDGQFSYLHGEPWAHSFVQKVIRRPDDALEILAYYKAKVMDKALPKQLKLGIAGALRNFSEYQLAKYKGENKEYKLVDLVNLTHPKSNAALKKLIKDKLKSPETWEVGLTKAGQKAETEEEKEELKEAVWKDLISENKIGYFALLRNLRNILEQAPDMIDKACELLVNEESIKKSLVLPFRFTTAYEQVEQLDGGGKQIRKLLTSLDDAVEISLSNVPKFDGETVVVLDGSGSMEGQPIHIGSLFASVLVKTNNCDFVTFSDDAKYVNLNIKDSVMTLTRAIENSIESSGTNFQAIFPKLNKRYDRVIILSDMQGWQGYYAPTSELRAYERKYDVKPYIYSFDLQGYGTLQFPESRVAALAGFSEKVFDLMKILEQDKQALIHKIEAIEL